MEWHNCWVLERFNLKQFLKDVIFFCWHTQNFFPIDSQDNFMKEIQWLSWIVFGIPLKEYYRIVRELFQTILGAKSILATY